MAHLAQTPQVQAPPWCPRCLADLGDPACCTPARLARIITVPAKACGCLAGDYCGCCPPDFYIGGTAR